MALSLCLGIPTISLPRCKVSWVIRTSYWWRASVSWERQVKTGAAIIATQIHDAMDDIIDFNKVG
jgi:hypothetical protein